MVDFTLVIDAIAMSALEVLASRADETSPVAYTNVSKEEMEVRLGSQDIPMILNTTPSVYATQQGGGAGDARINVRGFNQRNVAVMINGVPQNDMENGWVYWSNWSGLDAVTSNIQVQRGLGASSMAAAAITQAIYESAIPIAAQDAKTYATVDLQNLSNQQQAAVQPGQAWPKNRLLALGCRYQCHRCDDQTGISTKHPLLPVVP